MTRRGPNRGRRFPIEPIEAIVGDASGNLRFADIDRAATASDIATALGINHATARTWRARGLSVWQADKAANALGMHPCNIWPDYYDEVAA